MPWACNALGDFERAFADVERSLGLPNDDDALFRISVIELLHGRWNEAWPKYERRLSLLPEWSSFVPHSRLFREVRIAEPLPTKHPRGLSVSRRPPSGFLGEVSPSIQTASVIRHTLCDTDGGRCRWQCHTLGRPGIMPRKDTSRCEGAAPLGNTHRLRASITSLIDLLAFRTAGLKR
jgi:hypothetical protein